MRRSASKSGASPQTVMNTTEVVLHPADIAIIGLLLYVVGYDCCARDGETISEGVDRLLLRHRWLTETVCAALYLHVSNHIPDRLDPLHWGFLVARRVTFWWQGR